MIGLLLAFFDLSKRGIQLRVGIAYLMAVAGLPVQQGVAKVVKACIDSLGGCAHASEGLPSCIEEDVNFLGFA